MPAEDVSLGAADAMTALDSHGAGMVVRALPRLMRGRAAVVERDAPSSILWTPRADDEDKKVYRGEVLALGLPGLTLRSFDGERWIGGVEVPWGVSVGAEVLFQPSMWLDKMRTFEFLGVRGRVWILGQEEIEAVVE